MTKYHADNCEIFCENNDKTVSAEVLDFQESKYLTVSIERRLKMNLSWNGRIYEGRFSGMSFTSKGPKIITTKDGRNA